MCPSAIAGLGFKYSVTNSSDRLGHPFKKPFCKALNREDILGLHIAWCPNLTVLACVRTECVNMDIVAAVCTVMKDIGDCGARVIQGPACDWSLVAWGLASSSPWEAHSCA